MSFNQVCLIVLVAVVVVVCQYKMYKLCLSPSKILNWTKEPKWDSFRFVFENSKKFSLYIKFFVLFCFVLYYYMLVFIFPMNSYWIHEWMENLTFLKWRHEYIHANTHKRKCSENYNQNKFKKKETIGVYVLLCRGLSYSMFSIKIYVNAKQNKK